MVRRDEGSFNNFNNQLDGAKTKERARGPPLESDFRTAGLLASQTPSERSKADKAQNRRVEFLILERSTSSTEDPCGAT